MKQIVLLEEHEKLGSFLSVTLAEADMIFRKYFVSEDGAMVLETLKNRHGPMGKVFVYHESSL